MIAEQATNGWNALFALGSIALMVVFLIMLLYMFSR